MSPVASQMMSNMSAAMLDVIQIFLLASFKKIEQAAVAGSVALYTHCWAVQLSEHCQPCQRIHTKIENCKFFGPNESKSLL